MICIIPFYTLLLSADFTVPDLVPAQLKRSRAVSSNRRILGG
jgi:hypothetical protein